MNELEVRINATIKELSDQRILLGDRAAALAAELAICKMRLAEMEKPKAQPDAGLHIAGQ